MDQSIGTQLWVLMKDQSEIKGTLVGFDEYVNIVMQNVEYRKTA